MSLASWLINGALVGTSGVVIADTASTLKRRTHTPLTETDVQQLSNALLTLGMLLWPVLFDITVGYDSLAKRPRLLLGFAWPVAITSFSLNSVMDRRTLSAAETKGVQRALNNDAQAIISAAFAMGALLSGLKSASGTHIIMYALILSLAFVVPSIVTSDNAMSRTMVTSGQSLALNWAIGLIMTGISSDLVPDGARLHKLRIT